MDGKNSSGRRISLLNDCADRLPSIPPSLRSRTSSSTSSPIASPSTPPLVRSNSADSVDMQTPSPITPDFPFDAIPSHQFQSPVFNQASFFPQQKELPGPYSLSQPAPLPYRPAPPPQPDYFRHQRAIETHNAAATPNPRSKKNSYPCPVAKQFNCDNHFTTSGHAARHAKKHTGKKDAFCPECNKAFTRKDNMEQHRRTHQTGRNAAKGTDNTTKKAKAQVAKRPRPAPLQSELPTLSSMNVIDPTLPISPSSSFMAPAVQPADQFADFSHQRSSYPDPTTAFAMYHGFPATPVSNSGLDALAIAASGEKRKYE